MHRINRRSLLVAATLFLGCGAAFTHEGMEHVMGTVAAVTGQSITVETIKHAQVVVLIDPSTKYVRGNSAASFGELKVGDRVVVHAKLNLQKQLVGVEVKWGSVSTSAK